MVYKQIFLSTGGVLMSINVNLKKIREEKHFTQRELAIGVNVSSTFISCLERGTKTLSLALAYDISKFLDCSLYDLLGVEKRR